MITKKSQRDKKIIENFLKRFLKEYNSLDNWNDFLKINLFIQGPVTIFYGTVGVRGFWAKISH